MINAKMMTLSVMLSAALPLIKADFYTQQFVDAYAIPDWQGGETETDSSYYALYQGQGCGDGPGISYTINGARSTYFQIEWLHNGPYYTDSYYSGNNNWDMYQAGGDGSVLKTCFNTDEGSCKGTCDNQNCVFNGVTAQKCTGDYPSGAFIYKREKFEAISNRQDQGFTCFPSGKSNYESASCAQNKILQQKDETFAGGSGRATCLSQGGNSTFLFVSPSYNVTSGRNTKYFAALQSNMGILMSNCASRNLGGKIKKDGVTVYLHGNDNSKRAYN